MGYSMVNLIGCGGALAWWSLMTAVGVKSCDGSDGPVADNTLTTCGSLVIVDKFVPGLMISYALTCERTDANDTAW